MARRIYGLLPENGGSDIQFAAMRQGKWTLLPAAEVSIRDDDEVTVFAPAIAVAHHAVELPARGEVEARRAAPYAVEEEIAVTAESQHVALGPRTPLGEHRIVYVVDEVLMDRWVGLLDQVGATHAAIAPEQEVLPDQPVLVELGDRALASLDDRKFAVDMEMASNLLRALVRSNDGTTDIVGEHLAKTLGAPMTRPAESHPLLQLIAMAEARSPEIDLRQGRFKQSRSFSGVDIGAWRWPAALAAAAAIGWLLVTALETASLQSAAEDMRAEAERRYAAAYPGEPTPNNLVQATRRNTPGGGARGAMDFVSAAALLYEGLEDVEGSSLRSIRFDSDAGSMRASIGYPNYGADTELAQILEQSGLTVTLGDSRQDGSQVIGDVTLEVPR